MPDLETVVSGSTETAATESAASSTTDTQTAETPTTVESSTPTAPPTDATPQEKRDWRKEQRENADLNAYIQSEIAKARARDERRALKSTAKTAVETENVDVALDIARRIAAEPDEVDEDQQRSTAWQAKADKIAPHLERLLKLDATGQATNPYYVKLHQSVGKAEMDRRYDEDPEAFFDWADDQIQDMKLDEKLKKVAPSMARAIASDQTAEALKGMPTPLTGGTGGSGAVTVAQYNSDPALRAKLRSTPEGRKQIDEMMARASRG